MPDERDPWSHIGYWGDHQIVYLLRLLDAWERHEPGAIGGRLGERLYACADVPYRIADFAATIADPKHTIAFDRSRHEALLAARAAVGADGSLVRDDHGEVRLVTLAEKLLVPLLVKLTNLVPGSGIWLNTQRPEWNDANNALAGWGLSRVTLCAISRYLDLLGDVVHGDGALELSLPVSRLLEAVTRELGPSGGPMDDETRYAVMERLSQAGGAHRRAVAAGGLGEPVVVPLGSVRALISAARSVVRATIRAGRRTDGLYHSYDLLRVDGHRASIGTLGVMLEGQVAVLESGLLGGQEAIALLDALRSSELYRADQHSYLLIPDRPIAPFLSRNTLSGRPPLADPGLFVADRSGAWHFQADLSTIADVQARLDAADADEGVKAEVRALWRATFGHDAFTGRSDRFFMFEGLGSIYWHMVAKLLLAVRTCHGTAHDPAVAAELAVRYHDIRDGLGFRRTPESYGAFPTDPYSHSPRHRGAQQPGMTGQVKEQVLTRFGELGVEVRDGCLHLEPRLLHRSELETPPGRFRFIDVLGQDRAIDVPAGCLAFTYCQVPVVIRAGVAPSIELDRADGRTTLVAGTRLGREASRAIFSRSGAYRRLTVTVQPELLHPA